jgi:hypothetical protein
MPLPTLLTFTPIKKRSPNSFPITQLTPLLLQSHVNCHLSTLCPIFQRFQTPFELIRHSQMLLHNIRPPTPRCSQLVPTLTIASPVTTHHRLSSVATRPTRLLLLSRRGLLVSEHILNAWLQLLTQLPTKVRMQLVTWNMTTFCFTRTFLDTAHSTNIAVPSCFSFHPTSEGGMASVANRCSQPS